MGECEICCLKLSFNLWTFLLGIFGSSEAGKERLQLGRLMVHFVLKREERVVVGGQCL